MASSSPATIKHISLLYRLYFLYFDPLGAVAGTCLILFDPTRFLSGTIPLPVVQSLTSASNPTIAISPVLRMQLINVAALYMLIAAVMGVVLRLTRQKSIWLAVLAGMICSDVGHLYAVWLMDPERMMDVAAWTWEEWINYGTLSGGLSLRIAFLMGAGRI